MIVNRLELSNYRNYETLDICFNQCVNVLFGDNAQGKTNLLEALYLFSCGRSHRTKSERELIRFGEAQSDLRLSFTSRGRDFLGRMHLQAQKSKSVFMNGVPVKKVSQLPTYFQSVLFSPQELGLVTDGPDVRRRFLDLAIMSMRPAYFSLLSNYHLVLKQKNNLLKAIYKTPSLAGTLFVWNDKLAEFGSRILLYRDQFLRLLCDEAQKIHAEITNGAEVLEIHYLPSVKKWEGLAQPEVKALFLQRLEAAAEQEKEKGLSLIGCHRDDLGFFINGRDVRRFGSQGQQRTVVLSLKVAQTEILKKDSGEYPVLLLDDIMSELDAGRRSYLLSKMAGKQVVITCTDTDRVRFSENVSYFKVENGRIHAE